MKEENEKSIELIEINTSGKPKKRSKKQQEQIRKWLMISLLFGFAVFVILLVFFSFRHFYLQSKGERGEVTQLIEVEPIVGAAALFPDLAISEQFLTINEYSRPGLALTTQPQYIVVHYTANPGSTAQENRDYFENLKDSGETYASAQFVIGLAGEIIQCVPCNEMSYCSNQYNEYCISIEMCHPDETGAFNNETYNSCVYLVAHLMNYYQMEMEQLIRHYDITGKNCPKQFVENEEAWTEFKEFVQIYREDYQKNEESVE